MKARFTIDFVFWGLVRCFALALAMPMILLHLGAQSIYENYTFVTIVGPAESGIGWHDGDSNVARFNFTGGMATDTNGNLYVTDINNHTIRKITPDGLTSTLAGLAGVSGTNDGFGAMARFQYPEAVAIGSNGVLYVADVGNHTIRRIAPDGSVTTLAGLPGIVGSNDGVGSTARFNQPAGLAVDSSGNVIVADSYNHTIRSITPGRVVTTIFGSAGFAGTNNGTAATATFNYPRSLAIDRAGNIFVADSGNHTIRKISASGNVTSFAGLLGSSGSRDGIGSGARFNLPFGVTIDQSSNLWVADTYNHTIRKVSPAGSVTTVAGLAGTAGNIDGKGTAALFNLPYSVATSGNIVYVADTYNHAVRQITNTVVTTIAGSANLIGSANGIGATARFNYPTGLARDNSGNLYVTDLANHMIRKITPTGAVSTLAGLAGVSGTANGTGTGARFNTPVGIVVDSRSNLYVADAFNHSIRKITPAGTVTTLAGSSGTAGTNNGTGSAARFNTPFFLALDANTNLYVADTWNHTIRKITPAGVVTTFAGSPGNPGNTDGNLTTARFNYPEGIYRAPDGTIYVADSENQSIRRISTDGLVSTIAGLSGSTNYGSIDGPGTVARFHSPYGLGMDAGGNLFITDSANSLIRKMTPTGIVTTIAGLAQSGGGADGSGAEARFSTPEGLVVDPQGAIFLASSGNQSIRLGYPALTDRAVANPAIAGLGNSRQLDVTNSTTTAWSWQWLRRPAASNAGLSSTAARNPTFNPDRLDLYQFRIRATNASGRIVLQTVDVFASTNSPQLTRIQIAGNQNVVSGKNGIPNGKFSIVGTSQLSLPRNQWSLSSEGNFDGNGNFTTSINLTPVPRFFLLRIP